MPGKTLEKEKIDTEYFSFYMQVSWTRDEIVSAAKDARMLKETNHEKS